MRWIKWFDDIGLGDVAEVGGKNASLGELRRGLNSAGVDVPDGFAVTASAYEAFLADNDLAGSIGKRRLGMLWPRQLPKEIIHVMAKVDREPKLSLRELSGEALVLRIERALDF